MNPRVLPITKTEAIALALHKLRNGELVVVPTDTVYGVACQVEPRAIARLYTAKEREPEPALPLLLANLSVVEEVAHVSATARRLMQSFWPGPLTLILPARSTLTRLGLSAHVGVRVPQLPSLWPLLEAMGGYLVVSSAQRSGEPPALTAEEALRLLGDRVTLVLDGGSGPYGVPSTIVDCTQEPFKIVRRGSVAESDLLKALGRG